MPTPSSCSQSWLREGVFNLVFAHHCPPCLQRITHWRVVAVFGPRYSPLEEGESLLQAEAQRPSEEVHRAAGHVWERQTDYTRSLHPSIGRLVTHL
jgi:hypothetical protein